MVDAPFRSPGSVVVGEGMKNVRGTGRDPGDCRPIEPRGLGHRTPEPLPDDYLPASTDPISVLVLGIDRVQQVPEAVVRPFPEKRPAVVVQIEQRIPLGADGVAPQLAS